MGFIQERAWVGVVHAGPWPFWTCMTHSCSPTHDRRVLSAGLASLGWLGTWKAQSITLVNETKYLLLAFVDALW